MGRFADLAFTPGVKAVQTAMGSRGAYARLEGGDPGPDVLGDDEAQFLAERDSFYLASVSETGWPYIQHRGGAKGFVKVLDAHTLAFADLRGNRQYISVGNAAHDDRVALIFVDYPHRTRLKVLARARIVGAKEDPEVFARVVGDGRGGRAERVFVLQVEALDWNCPQHITPRFTQEEVDEVLRPLETRLAALDAENRELRQRLGLAAGSK
jgi:predicted pyridoxine 5'-phosphate oxidase superfamily flavin-nucleotide-binding protein